MKRFLGLALLIFVAVAGWRIGELLSTDALGMALGVIFGMMAGIPAALIALSASRMQQPAPTQREQQTRYDMLPAGQGMPHYPPVIIMAGSPQAQGMVSQQPQGHFLPMPRSERRYKILGEEDSWVNE